MEGAGVGGTASLGWAFAGRGRTAARGPGGDKDDGLAAVCGAAPLLLATKVRVTKGLAGGGALKPMDKGAVFNKAMCTKKTTSVKPSKNLKV
jgi:hypothetical protein